MSDQQSSIKIHPIRTAGLGNHSYVVDLDGVGLLVDPQRDIDRFLPLFEELSLELRWVAETHIHNDYVSGGLEASRRTGADLLIPEGADPAFHHVSVGNREEITYGEAAVTAIHTPGHTPEHMSYLLSHEGRPVAVFSGGSLLVGSAGRSDLLGADKAQELARRQFHSVTRLAELPRAVGLYPTHGAGSFCSVSDAGRHTSTIGVEVDTNPVLTFADEESFATDQLNGLQPYPAYYNHMAALNLRGGPPMPAMNTRELTPADIAGRAGDRVVVDMRDRAAFAQGHVPGSLGIGLRHDFATWVGWLVEPEKTVALVGDRAQDVGDALTQLARIGYDAVEGVMYGMSSWAEEGRKISSYRTVEISELLEAADSGATVVDVRAPREYQEGHLEGSTHIYVPDLMDTTWDVTADEIWIACGTGYRATIAAGMIERLGLRPIVLAQAGVPDLIAS